MIPNIEFFPLDELVPGFDLEPGSGRFDGPTPINDATDHAAAPLHGKRRIRMLPPRCSVSHEPSFEL